MNKTAHKLVSILILLASIFGLLAGAFGVRDALAVKTFLQGSKRTRKLTTTASSSTKTVLFSWKTARSSSRTVRSSWQTARSS